MRGRPAIAIELIDDPSWMGGVLYLRNLAISLSRLPESDRPELQLLGPPGAVQQVLSRAGAMSNKGPGRLGRLLRRLGIASGASRPADLVYPGFGTPIPGAVTLRWIPDFQHRHLPHLFTADEIAARDRAIGEIASQRGVVVLSSETSAIDFERFYPGHLAAARVWRFRSLVDTSVPADPRTLARHGLPAKFLYLPNQFWAHKNHILVFRALARLRASGGPVIPLVCTGVSADTRNAAHYGSLVEFTRTHGIAEQLHLLGLIERNEQLDIFRHAAAIVQPSLFEGWSTVVEDTRAVGRPILLSDIAVHREQAPPGGTYFDPDDDEALAALLADAWDQLPAGPDGESERAAALLLERLVLEAAYTFMGIANEAIVVGRAR